MGSFELELRGKDPPHGLISEEIYDKQGKKTPVSYVSYNLTLVHLILGVRLRGDN